LTSAAQTQPRAGKCGGGVWKMRGIFWGNPLLTAALPLATFYTSIIFNFAGRMSQEQWSC